MTEAIKGALDETDRRRAKQLAYNQEHGITPERFGFVREGLRRAHYRRIDGYVDAILMAYWVEPRTTGEVQTLAESDQEKT